ncbi:M28 family peptidase [Pseudoalteromonas sp. BDTF-M6]|uniref:M28 family peptidase n=1 Tax=Pseudoalteromonas sp. BDTF-M6 TaxID=2796132 RepID=UPI001BB03DDE|nr:M28 family peptidase [Pseudoalteromonas sp. BDTF-M6]MBS3796287.1 M28 family peptidase [Pseudoalteromonas sp. BDTF-M6]
MKINFYLMVVLGLFASHLALASPSAQWHKDLIYLSSEALAGRKAGSDTGALAGDYVQTRLQQLGYQTQLQPFAFKQGFFQQGQGRNIISNDCLRDCLVISAHYDHLGKPGRHHYPGANDNASGVAAILYLAEQLLPLRERITFAAFDAEENGLHGAKHFVDNKDHEAIRLNINLDMLNLPRANSRLFFYTREDLCPMAKAQLDNSSLKTQMARSNRSINRRLDGERIDWLRASDHWAFARKKLPFIFVTSADDPHYHQSSDTPEQIQSERYAQTLQLLTHFIEELLGPGCDGFHVR